MQSKSKLNMNQKAYFDESTNHGFNQIIVQPSFPKSVSAAQCRVSTKFIIKLTVYSNTHIVQNYIFTAIQQKNTIQ